MAKAPPHRPTLTVKESQKILAEATRATPPFKPEIKARAPQQQPPQTTEVTLEPELVLEPESILALTL